MSTTRAFTGDESMCFNRRVEAKPEPEAVVDRRSEHSKLVDFYYAKALRDDEEKKAERQRAESAGREKRLKAQAERDKVNKRNALTSAEFQLAGIFDQYGLSSEEIARVEDAITQRKLWTNPMAAVEFATVQAMEIAARRPKPRVIPWGFCEVGEEGI